jgi:hypothetical protein
MTSKSIHQTADRAGLARSSIRLFKTTAEALALRGYYKPSGRSGQTLAESLKALSPEIYGTMNDPRIMELNGLEYVIDRLPRGIEECTRIILTAEDDFEGTGFEKIEPLKRRRHSYRVGPGEISFVITSGISEVYDILTHLTFLNIEADKISRHLEAAHGSPTTEWQTFSRDTENQPPEGPELDRAIWNLSIILGRSFNETRESWLSFEKKKKDHNSNSGLFKIIHSLGVRALKEKGSSEDQLIIYFTPSLREMIGRHTHGKLWAASVKDLLEREGLWSRPLHLISANMHSVVNAIYAAPALNACAGGDTDFYETAASARSRYNEVLTFARSNGLFEMKDNSGAAIDCQIIDTAKLTDIKLHDSLKVNREVFEKEMPVLLVMDYAFGAQAFEVLDELMSPRPSPDGLRVLQFRSVSIMGKAGILPGKKGDIMLATAHVFEGTPHNYVVLNDLTKDDFDGTIPVHEGPMVTVLGTSLQNRDVLEKFQKTSWRAVGLEMEGGHYQRAVTAAIIRGHIPADLKVRYAYYASDNPLISGQTLSSGGLGDEGIRPTYMITKAILEKIFS